MGKNVFWKNVLMLFVIGIFAFSVIGCRTSTEAGSQENGSQGKTGDTGQTPTKAPAVTLTLLNNWNGGSVPVDLENNSVAKVIREKTGVTVKLIAVNQNEVEKVNTIFATQDLPDIYAGPAWAGGGEMEAILKAAKENQLVDLTPYLKKYPNLAKSVAKENVPQSMWDRYFDPGNFGGKSYLLYSNMPVTPKDNKDWLYGEYIRKDIAKKVGIDPQSVHTQEDFYNLLKKIKDANLTENGQSVIPMGGFHGGWAVDLATKMFTSGAGGFTVGDDGQAKYTFMTKAQDNAVLYIRKLISEGLIDPEAFTQSEAISNEKVAQGRYAILSAHYYSIYGATRTFVQAHPEAEFVPVGPLNDVNGDPYKTILNAQGNNVNAITKKSANPDAAARLLDFSYSDEGYLLLNYGVKGVHYDMVDGKPVTKAEWVEKLKADPKALLNEGIGAYSSFDGPNRTWSVFGGPFGHELDPKYKLVDEYTKIMRKNGVELAKGLDPGVYAKSLDKWVQIKPIADKLTDVTKQAYYAKTDEEALKLLNEARGQLEKSGIHDIEAAVTKKGKEAPLMSYVSAN